MKKLVLMLVAASTAASVSTQTVAESKTFDNTYAGINGGVVTEITGHKWLSDFGPNAGIRIDRYFIPVFGLAVGGNAYFSNKPRGSTGTVVRATNASLLGTVNLSDQPGGCKGEPRTFEVNAPCGPGWMHVFTNNKLAKAATGNQRNRMTPEAALDFAFNFSSVKQFQFYVEPSINLVFLGQSESKELVITGNALAPVALANHQEYGYKAASQAGQPAYNINNSFVQLNAGFIYKSADSNGTHNFIIVTPHDQTEIDALNAQTDKLRSRKPEVITKEVVKEVPSVKVREFIVFGLAFITSAQGKSAPTNDAKVASNNVKEGVHAQAVGTISPEGFKELNDRLSQARADVVANYLGGRGVIVDEAIGKGVQGVTPNRLVVVYVKQSNRIG